MKKVAIIVPAYNEERRIKKAASGLFSSKFLRENCLFLFIVDGTDKTGELLEGMDKNGARVAIKKYGKRLGKGGAVAEGIQLAETEYAGFVDVDEGLHCAIVEEMVMRLLEEKLDCIIGRRERTGGRGVVRGVASSAFNSIVNLLFGLGLSDTQCGCKFFKRELVLPGGRGENGEFFRINGFAFDVELLEMIKKNGGKITECGIKQAKESKGGFSLLESPKMLLDLIKLRLS